LTDSQKTTCILYVSAYNVHIFTVYSADLEKQPADLSVHRVNSQENIESRLVLKDTRSGSTVSAFVSCCRRWLQFREPDREETQSQRWHHQTTDQTAESIDTTQSFAFLFAFYNK